MIPVASDSLNIEFTTMPSLNYKMNIDDKTIINKCDELDAMKQVIYKILNTERYQYLIYSWNYGIELADLFGEPVYYVVPELERRITEALMQDDRIESVTDFEFDTSKRGTVVVTFTANTIFGEVDAERTVLY